MRRVFEVSFFAATALLQAAARAMRERGGSIVNLTSRTALVGVRGMAVYGASKGRCRASPATSREPSRARPSRWTAATRRPELARFDLDSDCSLSDNPPG